jgi:predicted ATPase
MLRHVIEAAEHFLTSLYVHDAFAVRDLEIPIALSDDRRRHLMLTGPNGSGKSSILSGVYEALKAHPNSRAAGWLGTKKLIEQSEAQLRSSPSEEVRRAALQSRLALQQQQRVLQRDPLVEVRGVDVVDPNKTLLAFMRAGRSLALQRPTGPSRIDEGRFLRSEGAAAMLLQFLVNLRMEQALAREDGDDAKADEIGERFQGFDQRLRRVLDDDGAHLQFDRSSFDFQIALGDGRVVDFDKLPDGIGSILFMWATLMIPAEALRRSGIAEPAGWAIIDEPELHLHARLQEMVLPFLVAMFPNVQLLVATHSPAVLASIPDATIFDLRARKAISSHEFRGIRYGTILTQHFGIDTDFDIDTTERLRRLKVLYDADPAPDTPEHAEMRALLHELSDRPHLLIAQVQKKLEFGDM